MDLHCDFCPDGDHKKPVMDFEFTHLGATARFLVCASCAGFTDEGHGVASIASIIYELQDKASTEQRTDR